MASRGCGIISVLLSLFFAGALFICCGGFVFYSYSEAKKDLQSADSLYDSGKKEEAVLIYQKHFIGSDDEKERYAYRIMEHLVETKDDAQLKEWADRVVAEGIRPKPSNDAIDNAISDAKDRKKKADALAKKEEEASSSSGDIIAVGGEGVLKTDGSGPVMIASSSEAFNDLAKFASNDDEIRRMLFSGEITTVPAGTRVTILARDLFGPTEVRIKSGDLAGRKCYVAPEFVRKP